jgi:S1-C subfamily serine protease
VDPALVDINVTFNGQEPGAGTGIVLTSNGEVLTNNHVVEGATSISVTDIGDGKTYGATVVGYDATDDVAVIQLTHASGLKTAKIGNSSGAAIGDAVIAIGNAGGTGGTPTATGGSITALDQAITASDEISGATENLTGLIETDANIQPGDSGGSLVDASGEVIGMDTAAAQGFALSSQTNQGYAIPINKALSIASQIESGSGSSTIHVGPTAYLGVFVAASGSGSSPYSGRYFDPYGSQTGSSGTKGAVISGVAGGGPAAKAGLSEGDAITSIDGQSVSAAADLSRLIQRFEPGESVHVGWTDTSGQTHTSAVTLGSGPAQ